MRLVFSSLFFLLLIAERSFCCEQEALSLSEKATEARESGKYREAIRLYRSIEKIHERRPSDSISILADACYFLGNLYAQTDAADSALHYYHKALSVSIEVFSASDKRVVKIYNGMASVYRYTLYDYQKAEEYFLKAYELIDTSRGYSPYEIALVNYNLATTYRLKGDYDRADIFLDQLLRVDTSAAEKNFVSLLASSFIVKANIRNTKGDYEKALPYYLEGIRRLISSEGKDAFLLGNFYNNLASNYYNLNEYRQAKHYYHQAILINKQHGNQVELSNNYFGLGELQRKFNYLDDAFDSFKKSHTLRRKLFGDEHLQVALVYREFGLLSEKKQEYDSALFYYQQGLKHSGIDFNDSDFRHNPAFGQLKKHPTLFMLLADKGSAAVSHYLENRDTKWLSVSLQCYDLAVQLLHYNRKQFEEEGSELYAMDHYHYVFQGYLRSLHEMWRQEKKNEVAESALKMMESCKAVILLESIRRIEMSKQLNLPDSLVQLESRLKQELKAARKNAEGEQQDEARNQLEGILLRQNQLKNYYKENFPSYYSHKFDHDEVLDVAAIRSGLGNEKVIVEYFREDSSWYVVGLSSKKASFQKVSIDTGLSEAVAAYRQFVSHPPAFENQTSQFDAYLDAAHALYVKLLQPVLDELSIAAPRSIIAVPDGELAALPFEAMLLSQKSEGTRDYAQLDYLLHRSTVGYGYSLKNYFVEKPDQSSARKVFGMAYSSGNTKSLTGTRRELQMAEEYFDGEYYYGSEANKAKFIQSSPEFDVLHLALHGVADREGKSQAWLRFASSGDSILYEDEIYNLRLKAALAVLSACETGTGQWHRGEGVYSLSRAFSYAGVRSQVISLWSVSDRATSEIIGDFYKRFKKGNDLASSLRQAKVNYLASHKNNAAHPYFWAAMVGVGDCQLNSSFYFYLSILGVIIGFMIVGAIIFKRF